MALTLVSVCAMQAQIKQGPSPLQDYTQVLDDFFQQAHGPLKGAVVLRVYGGLLPEYEIVLDPETNPKNLTEYEPKQSIWGNVFDLTASRQTTEHYVAAARKMRVIKKEFAVPEERIRDLWRRAQAIDTSTVEPGSFKDSKGHEMVIMDAPYFELILNDGAVRTRVTDTSGSDIVSSNPVLLQWSLDVESTLSPHGNAR